MLHESLITELQARTFAELTNVVPLWSLSILLVTFLCLPRARLWLMRFRTEVRVSLFVVVSVLAVFWAWSLLWASDDAYITFRYAENLAKGHGLVYNPGERVEGYTDFLWAVIAALVIALKGDPGQVTIVINLASFVALLFLVERLGKRLRSAPVLIGLATLLVAANYTMASFATACIETMFAAMLVTLAVERVDAGHPLAGGIAGIAATLSHPDHGLFYGVLAALLFLDRTRRRDLVRFLVPFVVVFIPYFVWRWVYYGDLMPNTFYAKSADKVYFEQGTTYLLITIVGTGLWLTLPLVAVGGYAVRRSFVGRYALIVLPLYLFYVAKVGGDFMLGRFFVAAIPFWCLLADAGYRVLLSKNRWGWALLLTLPATVVAMPITVVKPGELYHGVADERSYGNVSSFASMAVDAFGYTLGKTFNRELTARGISPKTALWSIGMSGYYSKLPVFDLRGLTSRSVAHLPIETRGRPGHEKVASPGLIVESGSKLSEVPVFPEPYVPLTRVAMSLGNFYLVRYEPGLVRQLGSIAGLQSFPNYLDGELPRLAQRSVHELACDLWHIEEYYFSKNEDGARKAQVIQAAVQADPSLVGAERVLLELREPSALGYQPIRRFSFDRQEALWVMEGQASRWVVEGFRAGQEAPFGQQGRYVNSYLPPEGDATTGRMVSPEFVLTGDLVTFKIGGGFLPDSARILLVVDNQPVRTATGCNSNWMGKRVWNVAPYRNKTAHFVLEDVASTDRGYLVLDEIVEWKAL